MTSRMDEWIRRCEGIPLQTREDLERLQFNKLNRLLRREKDRDGFYQLPSSLSSLEELSSLPFTTSEDIQNHAAGILLGSMADIQKVISDTTSGTTGAEKRIFYSERDLRHTVELFTVGISEMVKERDTVLIGMPYTGPDSLADLIEQAVRGLQAKPVRHSFGSFYEQCDWIHRTRPDSVICFPVWLLSMVRIYEAIYHEPFPARQALISADAMPQGVIQQLEEHSILLYPHYGSREMAFGGAVTCCAHHGMHLRENHVIAQIVDENGKSLPDGQWGELIITTVDMELFPLIRYKTGDKARFLKEDCACQGLTRRLDWVHRMDANAALMEQLDSVFFCMESVVDVKVRKKGDNVRFDFLVLRPVKKEEITALLKTIGWNTTWEFSQKVIDEEDFPLYRGKRIVIEKE